MKKFYVFTVVYLLISELLIRYYSILNLEIANYVYAYVQ